MWRKLQEVESGILTFEICLHNRLNMGYGKGNKLSFFLRDDEKAGLCGKEAPVKAIFWKF